MPRLKAIETTEADPKAKELLEGVQRKLGMTPNIMRTMAHSPALLEAYLGFSNAIGEGALQPKLREQIALTVGEVNRCEYCLSAHSALGKMVGLSDEEIVDSRRGVSPDRKTEAVLRFTSKMVTERGWVSDDDVASLRAAGTTDAELAEIVGVAAINIFTNYFNHVTVPDVDFPKVEAPSNNQSCGCG